MSSLIYETATPADYSELLALNEGALPAVNAIDEAVLARLHQKSFSCVVARDQSSGQVAGFLLSMSERSEYESVNFQYFKQNYPRFVYVDRIIVQAQARGRGIGAGLYADLFERCDADVPVTCEVNLRPPNPRSQKFHERLGFKEVDQQDTEGGKKRVTLLVRAP